MERKSWYKGFLLVFLFILELGVAFGQNEIKGYIKDCNSQEPLPGANVFLEGSKSGTSTNGNGYFQFRSKGKDFAKLIISHIGYQDTIITVSTEPKSPLTILLKPDSILISSIVVTATRTQNPIQEIPRRIDLVSSEQIAEYPSTNTDDLLKMLPGIVVNRSWGIFSRNASVTMRGMPGASRSLILLDGVPLNKTAGGSVNWHLISPDEIGRIEVVKGPGSALYGNNAMGGIINMITKAPKKKLNGMVKLGYGTYNTFSSQAYLNGQNIKEFKGLYWKLGGFYRQGDGYILMPEEIRDSTSSEAFLYEGNASGLLGYQFGPGSHIELDYRFYKDKRSQGIQVYEKDGSCESFMDNNIRLNYKGYLNRFELNVNGFVFSEIYTQQNEKVNSSGQYKLTDIDTEKLDMGVWMSFSRSIKQHNKITAGLDLKHGSLDNQEVYRTATDEIYTEGILMFAALFLQDEISILKNKLKIIAGLRLDYANYYNGSIEVNNPTSQTGFPGYMKEDFPESNWIQVSPKVSARYLFNDDLSTYLSASTGFMPPRLDDLSGTRKIRKGFKIANPELKPEVISSFEWGIDCLLKKKLSVKPSVFYSLGNDFQYLVATGDYIDAGSEDPITVFQRQNVSKVQVMGAELGIEYWILKNLKFTSSYAYNSSEILEYSSSVDMDLTGKTLNEVPQNLVFLGLGWKNKFLDIFIDYTFTDDQWYDEENTQIIDGYSLINLRLSKHFFEHFVANLDVQDLLDEQFIDRKGYLSPGRFFMFELKYLF